MSSAILVPLVGVIICTATLYGCYVAFDRLQTRIEQSSGSRRWLAIALAAGVGLIAMVTFCGCFALSAGLLQGLGLNLR